MQTQWKALLINIMSKLTISKTSNCTLELKKEDMVREEVVERRESIGLYVSKVLLEIRTPS